MRNNIGYPNKNANMTGVDTMFNTWDLGITPAAKDFASITDPSVSGTGMSIESSGALGPRAADGSMPAVDFLKLAAGSQMIDKGTDVGLPFVGAAPDLGAYEYGATTTTGTGGASGPAEAPGREARARRAPAAPEPVAARRERRDGRFGGARRRHRRQHDHAGTGGTTHDGHRRQRPRRAPAVARPRAPAATRRRAPGGRGRSEPAARARPAAPAPESSSGCSCTLDAPSRGASLGSALAMLGALSSLLLVRRRRRATART